MAKKFSVKKMLLSVVALASVAALSIAGTVAYLQDTDSDVNVMTLGNVSIEQHEYQRAEGISYDAGAMGAGNGIKEGDLVPFEQGQKLYPAVPTADDAYTAEMNTANLFFWGDYVYTGTAGNGLWNDAKLSNVMDKMVFVENTGKSDAYFRTVIAFECPEGMDYSQGSDKEFMMNTNGGANYEWESPGYIVIDGTRYYVMVATYQNALKPGNQAHPSLLQVVMTHNATNEDMELLGDTYEILVVSQAVQAKGFADAETALNAGFGAITEQNHPWTDDVVLPIIINDAEDLKDVLTDLTDAGSGSNTVYIADDIDASDIDWTPIKVDGYHGADIITIEGQGKTITGLDAPLFQGGFAGNSGIVIKDLTIADSNIVSTNTLGSGAFIESVDSMPKIVLDNCHLKDSTVTGGNGSRTGGLIGWTAGYNNVNDGPVKTYVTITNCTVDNCTITSNGSVGGIYGHAGNNAWTYSTVENCAVTNCELISTDDGDWRVGVVVGTANVGEMTISNITKSGNTLTQTGKTAPAGQSNLYGRFVPGTTGKLIIDGVAVN